MSRDRFRFGRTNLSEGAHRAHSRRRAQPSVRIQKYDLPLIQAYAEVGPNYVDLTKQALFVREIYRHAFSPLQSSPIPASYTRSNSTP